MYIYFDPEIPVIAIYNSVHVSNDVCMKIMPSKLFVIAKDHKQPWDCLHELQDIHLFEYHAAIKNNEGNLFILK